MGMQGKIMHALGFAHWRDRRGNIRFVHRIREAVWIVLGKWSLHRAYQIGLDEGSRREYQRVICNMGDIESQRANVARADANIARFAHPTQKDR